MVSSQGNCTAIKYFDEVSSNTVLLNSTFNLQINEDSQYYSFTPINMSAKIVKTSMQIGAYEFSMPILGVTNLTCKLPFN